MEMKKLTVWFEVLKQGYILANPEKWKTRQILANTLAGLLVAVSYLVSVYGLIPIPVDPELLAEIATGVAAVIFLVLNNFLTVATTKKIGIKTKATDSINYNPDDDGVRPRVPNKAKDNKDSKSRKVVRKEDHFLDNDFG